MNYHLAILTFVLSLLCILRTSGVQPHSDGRFPGEFKLEESMYYTNQGRFGRGPKFGFFRICSPWHPLRWWLPDFLKNVSTDGMNNFCDIVRNENLTKAETEQQLNQWSREQGDEVSEKFKNYTDQKNQMRANVEQKTQELIANISKFIDDQEKILRDTSLTSRQEKEQLMDLMMGTDWVVVRLARMIRKEAHFLAGEHRRGACPACGPRFPSMPFPQHGFDFGPDMPGRGPQFVGDGGEAFAPYGPFSQEGPFEQNESSGRNGPPGRNGPWTA